MLKHDDIHAILRAIQQNQRFLVTAHARPDGDAVGSILAMGMLLRELGKEVDMVSCDGIPPQYARLPTVNQLRVATSLEGSYDAAVLLECDGVERSGLRGLQAGCTINIDHHFSGKAFAGLNWIENDACAVAAMVYELVTAAGARVTPEMASCLYTGVLTDTGSFCYAGTDERTFEVASALVGHGADPVEVARRTYFSNPVAKMRLLGCALSTLQREGRLAWMWVTQEDMHRCSANEGDCEGLVNYAIGIDGVDAAVFLHELTNGKIRLSLRSKGPVNVADVAEHLGGGGHVHAGGCTLDGPMRASIACILTRLRKGLEGSTAETAAS